MIIIEATSVITTNISYDYTIFSRERTPSLTEDTLTINYRMFSDECMSNIKIY